jgi:predicted nucleic acid-binding protein
MRTFFVDTNLFVRYFAEDDLEQTRQAEAVFRRARKKEITLVTAPPVFFETAWVLRGDGASREDVLAYLESLCSMPGLAVDDSALVKAAVHVAREKGLEFADAYIASSAGALNADGIATFNRKDFKKAGLEILDL